MGVVDARAGARTNWGYLQSLPDVGLVIILQTEESCDAIFVRNYFHPAIGY